MRQPDIEIYLKDADQQAIAAWLSEAIGPCSEWRQQGQTFKCRAGEVPVTWLPKAVGKWHSLYLESDATPWSDDLACARAAFAALGVQVRCAPVAGARKKRWKKRIAGSKSTPRVSRKSSGAPIDLPSQLGNGTGVTVFQATSRL